MSGNKERVLEKSIGVRSQWKVDKSSLAQGWVTGISGTCNTAGLNAKPLMAPIDKYSVSIPSKKIYENRSWAFLYSKSYKKT